MIDLNLTTLLLFVLGGSANALITVVALKTDMRWLKESVQSNSKRILHLERKHG